MVCLRIIEWIEGIKSKNKNKLLECNETKIHLAKVLSLSGIICSPLLLGERERERERERVINEMKIEEKKLWDKGIPSVERVINVTFLRLRSNVNN